MGTQLLKGRLEDSQYLRFQDKRPEELKFDRV